MGGKESLRTDAPASCDEGITSVPPGEMATEDIRAELRHDLRVYEEFGNPLSMAAMGARITVLVEELDARVGQA